MLNHIIRYLQQVYIQTQLTFIFDCSDKIDIILQNYKLMYSNYLVDVGKLIYIIGQIQATSSFKRMLDSNNDQKSRVYIKCIDELPITTYKKLKADCRRKGILKCQWFTKIVDKSPMMIFMVFNFSQPLDANEKWEDRLKIALIKINKVYDILRSSNKQDIVLRIIIIISKEAVLQSNVAGNIVDKITSFLKNYEKELNIYQSDQVAKQVGRNKSYWFTLLDKSYQRKYRAINKRKEESSGERRVGCIIKMAVISQIISKKDSIAQYDDAYRSLHFRFLQTVKNKVEYYNFDIIRELRSLADVILLRKIFVRISMGGPFNNIAESITNHLRYFYQSQWNDKFYYVFQNMIWRQNFLQNLLQILYSNDHLEIVPKSFYAMLVNSSISLSYTLAKSTDDIQEKLNKQFEVKGRIIPCEKSFYIGSRNYALGLQITDIDIIWTEMMDLIEKKKDFITRGLQTITRYKGLKIFKKHQISFFNVFLLRFYLMDKKLNSIGNIFNEIIKSKIAQYDFYSLNYLVVQLQKEVQRSKQHQVLIHSLAVLIADYFKNKQELEKYGLLLAESLQKKGRKNKEIDLLSDETELDYSPNENKQPLALPLPSQSLIFSLEVVFPDKIHMIQKPLVLTLIPKLGNRFLSSKNINATLHLTFNKSEIKCQYPIKFSQIKDTSRFQIILNPLQYFFKDEVLELKSAVLITDTNPEIHWIIQNIYFPRYKSVILITKLKVPQIKVVLPYDIFFVNQTSKLLISIDCQKEVKTQISFSVSEQSSNNTEVFINLSERLNIVNSNCMYPLSTNSEDMNIIFMKSSKLGQKKLKFVFNITLTQLIDNKELKDYQIIQKEVGFKVNNLFKTMKIFKQAFSGSELKNYQIPTNTNIIMSYHIKPACPINIIELGQHTSPKPYFKSHKNITPVYQCLLAPQQRLKTVYIFEVLDQYVKNEQKKELFLIYYYVKWARTDLDQKLKIPISHSLPITNIYNQDDIKISLKNERVAVEYDQGKILKKRIKETLTIKYRNLTGDRIHVYSTMDNSEQILRIGNRGNQVILGPRQTKIITFQILPVKSGYYKYPFVRSYFDGIEAKEKACSNILCVI